MTDITSVPSLFRIWIFKLVVVLDVYSRFPLAFRVFSKEPASAEIAGLVQEATGRFGKPSHFVTDCGAQFSGDAFVKKLRDLGTSQRFGAIGQSGSIAIIERLWRTLKEMLDLRFRPPLSRRNLAEKVAVGLHYYAPLRPHQGLAGPTPAEIYFARTPATAHAVSPLRASSRDPSAAVELPFDIAYADLERRRIALEADVCLPARPRTRGAQIKVRRVAGEAFEPKTTPGNGPKHTRSSHCVPTAGWDLRVSFFIVIALEMGQASGGGRWRLTSSVGPPTGPSARRKTCNRIGCRPSRSAAPASPEPAAWPDHRRMPSSAARSCRPAASVRAAR